MKLKKILYDDVENHQMVEGYFLTENDLFTLINECMQEKASYDGTNFTPTYEVQEFLIKVKKESEKQD